MIYHFKGKYWLGIIVLCFLSGCAEVSKPAEVPRSTTTSSEDGPAIFQQSCASCHNPMKDATGPALNSKLISNRTDEWLYQLINDRENLSKDSLYWARVKEFDGNECAAPSLDKRKFDVLIGYLRSGISCTLTSPNK